MVFLRRAEKLQAQLPYSTLRFFLFAFILLLAGANERTQAAQINVPAHGDLQAALDAAQPGDQIVLEAGASYLGPFTLPYKAGTGTDADWITIRTSTPDALLPAPGARITPAHSPLLPKLLSPGGNSPALQTAAGAHHYRLLGIEVMPADSNVEVTNLVMLGDGSALQNTLDKVPHHLLIERCYIHAFPEQALRRGVALNSASTDILDSYLSEFKATVDAQAVWGWNGPGPFRIVNNYLEASGEVAGFGGTEPAIPSLVPSDIEFRRNYCTKQVSWRGKWLVKNLFELKNGQRVVVEGNILENNWADGQVGYAIVLTPGNGTANASAVVQDINILNNVIRHTGAGVNILDYGWVVGNQRASRQTSRITIRNNLFQDVNANTWGGEGTLVKLTGTPQVTFDHNTVLQSGNITTAYGNACEGFQFTNNIVNHNDYGLMGGGQGGGNPTIAAYFPNSIIRRNVIVGALDQYYPSDNFYPSSLGAVGFADQSNDNYRLLPTSAYKNAATDGKDVGCDFDALNAALTNTPGSTTPTPTPLPTPVPTPAPTPVVTPNGDVVWFEDVLPAGANAAADTDSWNWVSSDPASQFGKKVHRSSLDAGFHQHFFTSAIQGLLVKADEKLFIYVYLDPANMPKEIMLQWQENSWGWEHRAYWGDNRINYGTDGTRGRRYMGALPEAGKWVRLEVPASLVELEGSTITGMAFTLYGGRATWDRTGKASQTQPTPTPTPTPTPNPTPTPSPSPTPNPTPTPSPTPTPTLNSPALVSAAYAQVVALAAAPGASDAQIDAVVRSIDAAYAAFMTEANKFPSATQIDGGLRVSLYFSRASEALAAARAVPVGVQNRLQITAARLNQVRILMSGVTGSSTADFNHAPVATTPPVIGAATTYSSASFSPVLSAQSLGTINGDAALSPLALTSLAADRTGSQSLPYELAGASVMVAGRAAQLLYVSPARISFCVPQGVPQGEAEVIVTSQDGYVSRGTTIVNAVAPGLFTVGGNGVGQALVLNGTEAGADAFDVTSAHALGLDKRTRLLLFATGIGAGVANASATNDVRLDGGVMLPNVAESVTVEARTGDGRVFQLPVEFAGAQGGLPGLDQINVVLVPELRGAGLVNLTVLAAGQRSNAATINVK
ncbi:MAG TPA: hypothetical protein VJT82_08425 [Pyrinomonadaceae bacterium]|nr:hypothetical protein [Pyrinomonadaceae bacterium]